MDYEDIDQLRQLMQELEERAYAVRELYGKAQKAEKQGFYAAAASYVEETEIAMTQVAIVRKHMIAILSKPVKRPS